MVIQELNITRNISPLINFWRTLEIPLISSEINLILTWYENCVISSPTGKTKFAIKDIPYIPVVLLSTQGNIKLLKQLESGFNRIIKSNKYQSKVTEQDQA